MNSKWIGAVFIIGSCGFCGFSIAGAQRREEFILHQLKLMISFMEGTLRYELTPLPELMVRCARESNGILRQLFYQFAENLDHGVCPDVQGCLNLAVRSGKELPDRVCRIVRLLGQSLGRFDLPGQLKGLQQVKHQCDLEISQLQAGRDVRLRSYRMLGICAGMALAVLLI